MQGGAVGLLPLKLPPAEPQGITSHSSDTERRIYARAFEPLSQANTGAAILTGTTNGFSAEREANAMALGTRTCAQIHHTEGSRRMKSS